ncbi:MAG: helix-turn-helix domain-containing protein [Chloroflexi bacterium]|nr:helix-turn-helix domain-containing protein [Chloroflexota bacterium]
MAQDWITTRAAAELSGYHLDHLRRIIRAGEVQAQKFGETWQVSRKSLLAYLKEQRAKGERRGRKRKV